MNRWMTKVLVAGCLCAVGCGGGNAPGVQDLKSSAAQGGGDSSPGASGTGSDTSTGTQGGTADRAFEVRLRGVDIGDLESLLLRVKAVEVRANGMVLANTLMTSQMDLTTVAQAFLLTTFRAPAGVEEVEIRVALDSAMVSTGTQTLDVDLGCEVVRVNAKVKLLQQRNRAVIFLDLARSLAKAGTAMAFAPHLQLVY
ncbi:MAG: hypothetical protein ACJ78Y_00870 [Myxococcales bacterium]